MKQRSIEWLKGKYVLPCLTARRHSRFTGWYGGQVVRIKGSWLTIKLPLGKAMRIHVDELRHPNAGGVEYRGKLRKLSDLGI